MIAAVAFMHHTDNLLDHGPAAERRNTYTAWEKAVRKALATGTADHPIIRPLLRASAHRPQLPVHIEDFLAATTDLEFTGFAAGSDYQRNLDEYSLPAFMLVACLLPPAKNSPATHTLTDSHHVTTLLPPTNRPFARALTALEVATGDAALAKDPPS